MGIGMSSSASAAAGSSALPAQALLARLGSGNQAAWSRYLPGPLRSERLSSAKAGMVVRRPPATATSAQHEHLEQVPARPERGTAGAQDSQRASGPDRTELAGRVWSLSQDAEGCRQVQRELEVAESDAVREALAAELRGHILSACQSPHANHVVQKFIVKMDSRYLQFIIDEVIAGNVADTAKNKYGCRIIQRLIEFCRPWQVRELIDKILEDVSVLAGHQYGNYVVQIILRHGSDEHRDCIMKALTRAFRGYRSQSHIWPVLAVALVHGTLSDRQDLARVLVETPGLIACMADSRNGRTAAVRALQTLDDVEREEAWCRLEAEANLLGSSQHNRIVVEFLRECYAHGTSSPR